ncbi:MAG: hypothetical protein K2X81_23815, partial [Candidatus Obscuribacterales bacterium]|nr:hypothetical protein [Candidatus Obscuribacterales bacterium]
MSQLESMLSQLKKTLAEQKGGSAPIDIKTPTPAIDPKIASNALRDFLAKSSSTPREVKSAAFDDPQILIERRKALAVFVGVSLSNNGRAALPGTIDVSNAAVTSQPTHLAGEAPASPSSGDAVQYRSVSAKSNLEQATSPASIATQAFDRKIIKNAELD